jgi:hypothetical protein
MNMGCYTFVAPHLRRIMRSLGMNASEVIYIGREAQVGANGCSNDHKEEYSLLLKEIKNIVKN